MIRAKFSLAFVQLCSYHVMIHINEVVSDEIKKMTNHGRGGYNDLVGDLQWYEINPMVQRQQLTITGFGCN
jgi:hypothetical protein